MMMIQSVVWISYAFGMLQGGKGNVCNLNSERHSASSFSNCAMMQSSIVRNLVQIPEADAERNVLGNQNVVSHRKKREINRKRKRINRRRKRLRKPRRHSLDSDLNLLVQKHTVARIGSPFAVVPLTNGTFVENWLIRSIVPVVDLAGEGLVAMIGKETNFSAGDMYTGRHFCVFPGSEPVNVEKKNATKDYKVAAVWQCALPSSAVKVLFPPERSTERCLAFKLISEDRQVEVPLMTCHQPSALAKRAIPYNLAMCQANLAQFTAQSYLNLPPWLEYHARHGVDQFIIYVRAHRRKDFLKNLRPWLERGLVSLVMVDDDPSYVAKDMHNRLQIKLIKWPDGTPDTSTNDGVLINDCSYRLRHKATWATPQSDVDEYFVPVQSSGSFPAAVSPPDFSQPLLPKVLEPYLEDDQHYAVYTPMLWYEASEKPEAQIALTSTFRQDHWAPKCFKSIVRPELVDVSFTHWPTNTKRGRTADIRYALRFNHYRLTDRKLANITDLDFVTEAQAVQNAVCLAYGLKIGCKPGEWLPEGFIASGPPTSTISFSMTESHANDDHQKYVVAWDG